MGRPKIAVSTANVLLVRAMASRREPSTLKQIEDATGLSEHVVRRLMAEAGLRPRRPGPPLGPRPKKAATLEAEAQARSLRAAGLTFAEIGHRMDLTKQRAFQLVHGKR